MRFTKITIIKAASEPNYQNINELLQWFGGSLGLFNPRDKDKSCYRVFLALLNNLRNKDEGLTSDQIAFETALSRGTVVHHLNRLMDAGIVINTRGLYALKVESLEELVEQIRHNVNKTFDGLKDIGKHIDRQLNI